MIFLNGDKLKFGIFRRQVREDMLIQKCLFLFQEFRKVDPLREIKMFFYVNHLHSLKRARSLSIVLYATLFCQSSCC